MRTTTIFRSLLVVAFTGLAATAFATDTNSVAGVWWMPRHNGKIAVTIDAAGTANGRLIALEPKHADDLDDDNPDRSLRTRRVLGLVVLQGFRRGEDSVWHDGTLYSPISGSTYRGTMALDEEGKLRLRASVLFGLIGRTRALDRVAGPAPDTAQPGEPELVYAGR